MNKNSIPQFIDNLLNYSWEQICFLAYDGFTSSGRGVIAVFPNNDSEEINAKYICYDLENLTEDWVHILKEYDPETEFVLQFEDDSNNFRTLRIKTPEDGQHPKRVWFFQALAETTENPETLNNRPQWFLDMLDKLEKAKIKGTDE
ncbi:MAG: hypothetical protein ACR2J3_08105 [Aridibacter sp.]